MKTPLSIWNSRYSKAHTDTISRKYDNWMDRWTHLLEPKNGAIALDIGCGIGLDANYLNGLGFTTIASDLSNEALADCRKSMPENPYIQFDLREGLPFVDKSFQVINANLSLHYFKRKQTEAIISDIKRCLAPGGILLGRFNSTGDTKYGSVGHNEIEQDVFLVDGLQKRFFDPQSLKALFKSNWKILSLEELSNERYSKPKKIWEIVAENSQK